jgi:hypothetical protein
MLTEVNMNITVDRCQCATSIFRTQDRGIKFFQTLENFSKPRSVIILLTPRSRVLLRDNSHLATQEIPNILRNLKVHYRVYKSPPLVSVVGQKNPVHTGM